VRPLGVGLIFTRELLPILREAAGTISVVEVEPQTLWQLSLAGNRRTYVPNSELYDAIEGLPQAKLLHSVGLPVGSSRPLERDQVELLNEFVNRFQTPWASEHLSFNAIPKNGDWSSVGFLLPPLQCGETVDVAAAKLQGFSAALSLPVAFETNVNYLRPQADELPDGEFFRAVAERADCGIVIDLHNLWTNELNGRTAAADVLTRVPLKRVWEVHLAGGMPFGSQWLDAHSGAIPDPVLKMAAEWIPKMPNLGAIVFEITDEYVPRFGLSGVMGQVQAMTELWSLRPAPHVIHIGRPLRETRPVPESSLTVCREWEVALGELVIGETAEDALGARLPANPGVRLLRQLVADARAGFIAQGLHYTTSLLLCALGTARVQALLTEFMGSCPPQLFVSAEADAFANFLLTKELSVPYLDEVLGFEHALIRGALYSQSSTVHFRHDPASLFEGLARGQLPNGISKQEFSMLVQAS